MGPIRQHLPAWGLRVSEREERRGAGWPSAGPVTRAHAGRAREETGSAQMRGRWERGARLQRGGSAAGWGGGTIGVRPLAQAEVRGVHFFFFFSILFSKAFSK